ncbi:MAG: alpha/beta hydrolase [Solirubrobacteraceae bacterium]
MTLLGLTAMVVALVGPLPHAILAVPTAADILGVLIGAAGVVVVVMAFRRELTGRRLAVKLVVTVVVVFVVAQWLIVPAINAGLATNAPQPTVIGARALGLPNARDVSFTARDAVRLSGWWVPGAGTAAVVLLHGSHGSRMDVTAYLRMLHNAGYGVLAYDARGHGRSSGQANALGWKGADDLAGAVAFVRAQPGVDPRRIAALGLSMGAEESLRAAADGVPLAAVIADGAGASTLGDAELTPDGIRPVFVSVTWLTMRATALASGESEPAPLKDVVGRADVPVLLIASGRAGERTIDATYRSRIGHRATLWYIAAARHTRAFSQYPAAYTARVTAFLTAALGR